MEKYSLQVIATAFNRLSSSDNRGRSGVNDLGRLVRLLDLFLGSLNRRRGRISSGVFEGSNRSGLLNLRGSLVNLGGVGDILGLCRPEKISDTSGQTATDLDRRPGSLVLFLFPLLLLLGLLGAGLRDRSLGFDGSGGFSFLNRLREGSLFDDGFRSGGLLRLGINRGGFLRRSGGFLGDRSRRLKVTNRDQSTG